ncbi:metallophosphoesterase family protein [Acidipila rosea]|uniref:Calcineurin-like phosphoesterase family protein n=1 Tax=Acidipila rosea TaxID=768535 RepID=A0A4R1KYM1_9BACT|nr:metallophosphoesterase [Acidipila rosea]TCK69717.1 calcineurin-like phosphoesterase family protein [Acidipila rosea]
MKLTVLRILLVAASVLAGAAPGIALPDSPPPPLLGATIRPAVSPHDSSFRLIVYGDTRFTDPANTTATNPRVRQYLASKVAEEKPLAMLLTGDLPFIGAKAADWQRYRDETAAWRSQRIALFPTIGNHEMRGGYAAGRLNFLANFPELKGYLYYSAQVGNVYVISLDETQSTGPGSVQRKWLASQLEHLPASADFVFILDHLPLMADLQSQMVASLPAPPEIDLRNFIESEAAHSTAKFMVVSGHIHNYERFEHGRVTYVTSGGGGAKPYYVMLRGDQDLYTGKDLINYNYVVLDVAGKTIHATMYRVKDPTAPALEVEARDFFTLQAPERPSAPK